MRNIKIVLQYEGTRYQGWQRQESSENTIQGKLEVLLGKMCGEKVELQGSGRTDAGVHALGQTANFHTNCSLRTEEMVNYMNQYLPEDIAVISAQEMPERFHSRLHAKSKCYRYQVINSAIPDVFRRRYALEVVEPLNLDAMRLAAGALCGEHDFKAFTSSKKGRKSTVRRIEEIDIEQEGKLVSITFRGNGFLYHMVRILTGTLLEVGMGRKSPADIPALIAARDREKAGYLVPAKGLTLVEVGY